MSGNNDNGVFKNRYGKLQGCYEKSDENTKELSPFFNFVVKKNTIANRGKAAEKLVAELLQEYKVTRTNFDWQRLYDSRTAGKGRIPRQVGDFLYFADGCHGAVEVKTTSGHVIPILKQFRMMAVRQAAGGKCIIVHLDISKDMWRVIPFTDIAMYKRGQSLNLLRADKCGDLRVMLFDTLDRIIKETGNV